MGLEGEQLASLSRRSRAAGIPVQRPQVPMYPFNLLAQQSRAGCLGLGLRRLEFLAPLLNGAQLVVLQPCRLLEVPLPFRPAMARRRSYPAEAGSVPPAERVPLPAPAQILRP